jgi:hypothetical protein
VDAQAPREGQDTFETGYAERRGRRWGACVHASTIQSLRPWVDIPPPPLDAVIDALIRKLEYAAQVPSVSLYRRV